MRKSGQNKNNIFRPEKNTKNHQNQPQNVTHLLLGILGMNLVVPGGFSGPDLFVFALTTFSHS